MIFRLKNKEEKNVYTNGKYRQRWQNNLAQEDIAVSQNPPKSEVILEVTDKAEILIKPKKPSLSITNKIASMSLPVANWLEMEQEIEVGRMKIPKLR